MAADYIHGSPGQDCLNTSHSYTARSPPPYVRRRRAAVDGSSIEDRLQFPVRYVSDQYHLHNGTQQLEQTTIDLAADMILPRYMRQTIGSLQKAWINRRVVSGRPARTNNYFTYEADDTRQLEYGKSKNCAVNDLQLKPNDQDVGGNSGFPVNQTTNFLHKDCGSLKNSDHAMYSLDSEDQALIMQTGSGSRVQYNALRQRHRPIDVIIRHEPTTRKAMPLLGSRCHGHQSLLENSTELPSFIGFFPLSGITYKLNSREIKSQKPSKQPLGALESEFGSQFNLRPMTCNATKSSTGNRNNAQFHGNHNYSTNSLDVGGGSLKLKGDVDADKAEVEAKLFHVKIRTSRDDAALGKLTRYHQRSAQTVRCTQLKTILQRPATSTLTRAETLYKKNASAQTNRHNAVVHRKVTESQEIDDHRQEDKPNTEGTQTEHTTTNSEERLVDSVFPESSAAVGILRSGQSVVSIAPPLPPSPAPAAAATAAVNTLQAAPSVALPRPHHPIKSALFINNSVLSSARLVSGDGDKIRDRSARGWKGKVENENTTTWLRVVRHSKSPNQRRKVRPATAAPAATKRYGNGDERQSAFAKGRSTAAAAAAAASEEDELSSSSSSEKSKDVVDGSNDVILRQTLLEKREAMNAAAAAENSEEETEERNERICEWLLGLNYSDQERPPSPVIVEETPMQTDTAIHIVYNGD